MLHTLCTKQKKKKNTKYKQKKKKKTKCIGFLQKSFLLAKMQPIKDFKHIFPSFITSPVPPLKSFEFVQQYKFKSVKDFHDLHKLKLFELSIFHHMQ